MLLRLGIFNLLFLLLPFCAVAEEAHVLRVKDGDSVTVEVRGIRTDVRFIGVDCPEDKQEYGQDAEAFTRAFLSHGPVELEYDLDRFDPYDRLLAYVWKDGKLLNEELIRAGLGLAVYYKPNKKHRDRLEVAEKYARANRLGFWKAGGLKQTPAEYRRERR